MGGLRVGRGHCGHPFFCEFLSVPATPFWIFWIRPCLLQFMNILPFISHLFTLVKDSKFLIGFVMTKQINQSNFYEWNCVIQFSTNPAELHSLFPTPAKDHEFSPKKKLKKIVSPGWLFPSRDKALSYSLLRNVPRMQNNVKKDTLHRRSIMRVKCFVHRLSHDCHVDIDRNINININF